MSENTNNQYDFFKSVKVDESGALKIVDNSINTFYSEFEYLNGNLTKIETYDNNAKTNKLFTKTLTYNSGVLTSLSILNETNAETITKNINYNSNNEVISIEKI